MLKTFSDARKTLAQFLSRKSGNIAKQEELIEAIRKDLTEAEKERKAALDAGDLKKLTAATSRASVAREALDYAQEKLETMKNSNSCSEAETADFEAFLDGMVDASAKRNDAAIYKAFQAIRDALADYDAVISEATELKAVFSGQIVGHPDTIGYPDKSHERNYASELLDRIKSDGFLSLE